MSWALGILLFLIWNTLDNTYRETRAANHRRRMGKDK